MTSRRSPAPGASGAPSRPLAFLDAARARMIDDLRRFVEIESGSHDPAGTARARAALAAELAGLGFEEAGDGAHLVAVRHGAGRGRLLVLVHLDTIWPTGAYGTPLFRLDGDRALGPGALDMKASWVLLAWALRALDGTGAAPGCEQLVVVATADEELGSPTGRAVVERAARGADRALVLEPAREDGSLVVARGAVGAVEIAVSGRASHTSGRGASAIVAAARLTLALDALSDPAREVVVNVGLVDGGTARQVVADRCRLAVDLRAPTDEAAATVLGELHAAAEAHRTDSVRVDVAGGITRPAFARSPAGDRLLALARRHGAALGMHLGAASTRGGSDGNFTAALGVPTLDGLGAEGGAMCTAGEYVAVGALPRRAALLAALIGDLGTL